MREKSGLTSIICLPLFFISFNRSVVERPDASGDAPRAFWNGEC
jgi:hypothetical protein